MQTKLLVTALAAGWPLSASVFGQNANADIGWTRSTAADSMTGANAYTPNTYRAEKAQSREQEKFQHQEQQANNAGSTVTGSQAGSAKMNQLAKKQSMNSPAKSAKMNPPSSSQTKSPAANWRAKEGN
jgi:hypothetical protein